MIDFCEAQAIMTPYYEDLFKLLVPRRAVRREVVHQQVVKEIGEI